MSADHREAAKWAYRLLLRREPENEAVIEHHAAAGSLEELRQTFVSSAEYRELGNAGLIGAHADVGYADIEVDCSREDLAAMLARIATEWRKFGETEPHWSVLTGSEFLQENISETIEQFYQSGFGDVARLLKGIARSGGDTSHFDRVLDFGCGVGRLVLALADTAQHVTGVDISPAHLALARDRAARTARSNVDFAAIDHLDELDRFTGFDLVTSLIVIQHNPPPVQREIVKKLLLALRPGGFAVLQIPTYLAHAARFSVRDYLDNASPAMEMNALPQHVIYRVIDETGCICLEAREDGAMGTLPGISQTFTIQRKTA